MKEEGKRRERSFSAYEAAKRAVDFLMGLGGLVVMLPVFLLCPLLIRLTSKGPAIYTQYRIGRNGVPFKIYKFRTMVNGADDLGKHLTAEQLEFYRYNRKLVNDPRITPVGSILRKTSIDELPQIFNILRGEMSVVGPRPLLPEEIEMYGEEFQDYITVTPGLTGLWQIKSRHTTTMGERAKMDREYITKRSPVYDLRIFFMTFRTVFSRKGAC